MVKYYTLILVTYLSNALKDSLVDSTILNVFPLSLNNGEVKLAPGGWTVTAVGGVNIRFYLSSTENISSYFAGLTNDSSSCRGIESHHQIHFSPTDDLYYFEESLTSNEKLYLCISSKAENNSQWEHQGSEMTKVFLVTIGNVNKGSFTWPLGLKIVVIVICLLLSGLFSGLNLGLLSLDMSDLRVLEEAGSYKEKYYASVIMPLRKQGNFLLAAITLGNSFVNSLQTIVLDEILHGILTSLISTLLIVIFGEIIPQAICSKYGLVVGAKTSLFIRFVMIITSPLSWPVGKVLTFFLGKSPPATITREKIRALLKEQVSDVDPREIEIIAGVLTLKSKTAEEHMRKLKDVFMVDYNEAFDEKLFVAICDSGYSRIPVYRERRSNVVGVLHIKDLALINTSPYRTIGVICESFNLPFGRCLPEDNLHKLLHSIQQNHYHMLLVQTTDPGTKIVNTIGTITLEDIIEEMVEFEILDEFDRTMEEKRNRYGHHRGSFDKPVCSLPSQLKFGVLQFLPMLEPFSPSIMSAEVLDKLIEQCCMKEKISSQKVFYTMGKPCDYFMLILTGKAIMEAGVEKLKFEAGPFCHFGSPALYAQFGNAREASSHTKPNVYIPDFTLYTNEDISYLKITRSKWLAAARVSAFERSESVTESIAEKDVKMPNGTRKEES